MGNTVEEELQSGMNLNIRRKYEGPVDLFKPTFYISNALGEQTAQMVRDLIGGDKRFFEPATDTEQEKNPDVDPTDYNYNKNLPLIREIQKGARGAYWDILRQLRSD